MTEIEAVTTNMVREAIEVVYPGKKFLIKDEVEPQSEVEDPKEDIDPLENIIRETKLFNEAVNYSGVESYSKKIYINLSKWGIWSFNKTPGV